MFYNSGRAGRNKFRSRAQRRGFLPRNVMHSKRKAKAGFVRKA